MTEISRLTIYADDIGDRPSADVVWVRAWLQRWQSQVRVIDYSAGGWEHLWFVEGPPKAISEVPLHLHCCSEWSDPEMHGLEPASEGQQPDQTPEPPATSGSDSS